MKTLALFLVLLLSGPAVAGEPWNHPRRFAPETSRPAMARISMGDAMEMVTRATGGRVVLAQPSSMNGREGYRIKVVTRHGEVRVVYVDSETGAMQ